MSGLFPVSNHQHNQHIEKKWKKKNEQILYAINNIKSSQYNEIYSFRILFKYFFFNINHWKIVQIKWLFYYIIAVYIPFLQSQLYRDFRCSLHMADLYCNCRKHFFFLYSYRIEEKKIVYLKVDKNIKRKIQYKDLYCELELQGCLNLLLRMKICVNNSISLNRTIKH